MKNVMIVNTVLNVKVARIVNIVKKQGTVLMWLDVDALQIAIIVMAVTNVIIVKIVTYVLNAKIVIKCLIVIDVNSVHSVMASTNVISVLDARDVLWILAVKIV